MIAEVKQLEALLHEGTFLENELKKTNVPYLAKENIYEEGLIASESESLSVANIRRIARKVVVAIIEGGTRLQKMIETETYIPTSLTDTQKYIQGNNNQTAQLPIQHTENKPTLSETFLGCSQKGKKKAKTIDLMRSAVNLLIEWHGDRGIDTYNRTDMNDFKNDCLLRLPAYRNTKKQWKNLDARACCKQSLLEDETLAPKTINNYLAYICAVFSHAYKEHEINRNPATGMDVEELDDIDRAFSQDQLKSLYTNLKKDADKPSRYWTVIIAMYEGMRLNEICQLHTDDIYISSHDVAVIDINSKGNKKVKNKSSRRIIPIHPKLIELGLLDLVTERKAELNNKIGLLFSDVSADKYGNYIRRTSYWFNQSYKPILFTKEKGDMGYHSIRHSFIQQCQNQADMDDRMNEEISGHKPSTVGGVHMKYSRELKPKKMLQQLKKLKYDFE